MYANFDNEEARLGVSGMRGVAVYTKYELSVKEVITTEQQRSNMGRNQFIWKE